MPLRIIDGLAELKSLVGQQVGLGDWFEVEQSLIDAFAEVTKDRQWIHLDVARAKAESPYGITIAHGFLTLSLLSHLHAHAVQVHGDFTRAINYGFNRVRFPAPVLAGSRIRVRSTLQALEEITGGVQVTWNITVEIEGNAKPAVAAEWLARLYR
ncbi:MAG TPA: MaoC family dehydratase [Gemmataceae bacterium]|jgi:acyl dehydratase|nr:MaoC family dehydratase [Gemmataceae bacterium]